MTMKMPEPQASHQKLAPLVGDWNGEEKVHPSPWDPPGGPALSTVRGSWVADGFAVAQDYEQRRNGKVNFRGHGVFWYDPASQEYVLHWWDSMGGTPTESRGGFEGDLLRMQSAMPQGGLARTTYDLATPGGYGMEMEFLPNGADWVPFLSGRYRPA